MYELNIMFTALFSVGFFNMCFINSKKVNLIMKYVIILFFIIGVIEYFYLLYQIIYNDYTPYDPYRDPNVDGRLCRLYLDCKSNGRLF